MQWRQVRELVAAGGLSLSLGLGLVYSLACASGPQVGLSQQWLSWEQWAESVWLAH